MTATAETAARQELDKLARDIVVSSYAEADLDDPFEAALAAYRKTFPDIPKAVARQAVLFILESHGGDAPGPAEPDRTPR